jgi:D-lactate dehydrogenase (cytochrome)
MSEAGVTSKDELKAKLQAAMGVEAVADDSATLDLMAHDVFASGSLPCLVVRPASVAQLCDAVRICAAMRVPMVPRGGGASYTDGYLYAGKRHVLVDTASLNSIEIDAPNAVVTVGAGVTWAELKTALAAQGLRTPFWGPFSGLAATVGGSVSQNSLSHGSAAYGISAESVLSMDVVLASGELFTTCPSAATRHYGPDLTGLFTGDCGALGIKAAIRLPLLKSRDNFAALSFAFETFADYHAGVSKAQLERIDDEHFGLDIALSQGQIGRQQGMAARMRVAMAVLRHAPNKLDGIKQLISMALAGEKALSDSAYTCHFVVEGVDSAETSAKAARLRYILADHGQEIANSVPAVVRAMPFAPLYNILGPNGERWVPIHGVLRHTDAVAFDTALQAFYAQRKAQMTQLGIWSGAMFSPVGSAGFLYEIALYWPGERTSYHAAMLGEEHLASLPPGIANPAAREYVEQLKHDLIELYGQFNAAHFQIGRAYPYREKLSPQADALLVQLKATLDPDNLMNPGALGLGV